MQKKEDIKEVGKEREKTPQVRCSPSLMARALLKIA